MKLIKWISILVVAGFMMGCGGGTPEDPTTEVIMEVDVAVVETAEPAAIEIDTDDIAGVVTSANGPEVGVWVIAETDDLGTRFSRIVTTDNEGRYLVPDLPEASYSLWVRGYGLADSSKTGATPGNIVDLKAVVAPDAATAALVYPAAYWYAMVNVPEESEISHVPGGLNEYLAWMKNLGCSSCHQLGNLATRTFHPDLGEFDTHYDAWARRTQSGQAANIMTRQAVAQLGGVPFKYLGEWTERVEAGEIPSVQPDRPSGLERNIVVTVRDWSKPTGYMHDLSGTDRRDPTVNGYGPLYGAPELSTDNFPILDPIANTATTFFAPVRDEDTPNAKDIPVMQPSPYWGPDPIWDSRANAHNPMLDHEGRVWYTVAIRRPENPDWCREGSEHPSAKLFPTVVASRQLAVYTPDTGDYTFVDTCFGTHHLQFAEDEDNTLWTSGGGDVVGWLNTRVFDETGDAEKAIGWSALVMDINGNGQRDEYTEPGEEVNPELDRRIDGGGAINNYGFYAVMPSPVDESVWGLQPGHTRVTLPAGPRRQPTFECTYREVQRTFSRLWRSGCRH